ncbi:MAG: type IV secretory system conjugative DNA transfer family protein [Oscillospiraceae bacterium]|nr:type IV secretory system conjugative DNA transfer family protein [Oscillospiraceae bacterium]
MGNDRWATMDDLKEVLDGTLIRNLCLPGEEEEQKDIPGAGPVLAYQGRRIWSYGEEGHTLYLGSTGTGKSRRGIIPLLLRIIKSGESGIVVDPKTELFWKMARLAQKCGYDVRIVNFANIFKSSAYNALEEIQVLYQTGDPAKRETALGMVDELGMALFPESRTDPFWADSARSIFKAAVIALLEYAKPEEITLASVYQFMTMGDERFAGKTYLQAFLENLPAESAVARQLRSYCSTATETRAGIRSTFLEGLSLFSRSDAMVEFLSGDTLHISDLSGDKKTLIFICIPDHTPIYNKLCGILVGQLMSHLIRTADEKYHGALPIRHHVIVDEFGNVSQALPNMPHLLSAGRSRGLRVHYVLQSLSQLTVFYSSADAKTILNNTDIIIAFRCNDFETMESLSKMSGERTIDYGEYQIKEPLLAPAQFQELDTGQAFVSLKGKYRFVTFLPDYEQMFDCSGWEEPIYPERVPGSEIHLFDIKEYVTQIRRQKLLEMAEGLPSRPPEPIPAVPNPTAKLTDRIDEAIRKLEAQEKAEEEKKKRAAERKKPGEPKPNKTPFKYELLIINAGGLNKLRVAKIMCEVGGMSEAEARKALEALPASLWFKTKEEAAAAESAVSAVGALAFIQEHK